MAIYEAKNPKSREFSGSSSSGNEVITARLDTYILKALPEDLLTVLRGVAFDELSDQITAGNLPSQILVDGRAVGQRQIIEAKRQVSMRFADTKALIAAVRDIYNTMQQITRIQSPPQNGVIARQNFHLYIDGKPIGLLPGAIFRVRESDLNPKSVLRVVGPLVNYGRKLYWNPIGRGKAIQVRQTTSISGRDTFHYDSITAPRFKPYRLRTIKKVANAMPGNKASNLKNLLASRPGNVEGAGQIAKRVMRRDRRYTGLYFSDGWVKFAPAKQWGKHSRDDRAPSVSVQLAKKGAISIAGRL